MSTKLGEISTDEAKAIKVARWVDHRYGFRVPKSSWENNDYVWIDWMQPVFKIFGITLSLPRVNVALLELKSPKNWVLSVYGRRVFGECQTLAMSLAEEFQTHVHVKIVQEKLGARNYL